MGKYEAIATVIIAIAVLVFIAIFFNEIVAFILMLTIIGGAILFKCDWGSIKIGNL